MANSNNRPVLSPISISLSRFTAEVVTQFVNFTFIGGLWGCFNPTPLPGSKQALAIAQASKFVPLRPFSSLASVGHYGATLGSVVFVSRFVAGGMAVARNKHDLYNELMGIGAVYVFGLKVLSVEKRARWNNRLVGGAFAGALFYANMAP